MVGILDFIGEKIKTFSGITIGTAGVGTGAEIVDSKASIMGTFVHLDLLSLLQYSAYIVSISVGVLTILSWYRKNRKNKKVT